MTAIRSAIKPTRRPGELGVHSVDRFHFAVPDLAIAKNFYGEFGLDVGQLKFCEDKLWLHVIVQLTRDPLAFVILGLEHFRFAIPQRPRGLFYSLNIVKSAIQGTAITELDIRRRRKLSECEDWVHPVHRVQQCCITRGLLM